MIQVELPVLEDPESQDILSEAVVASTLFDSQLYLFEAAGTLVSLLYRTPDQASALLLSVVRPLLDELSVNLRAVKGPDDILPILKVHHVIMALGNVAKGFPEYPSPVPPGYIAPPLDVFREVAQAILVCLEAMNIFRVVRDAVRLYLPFTAPSPILNYLFLDTLRVRANLGYYRVQRGTVDPTINGKPTCTFRTNRAN